MPLTRHLYELDEVVSALQICLYNGWGRALFWLWELVVSQEETIAREILLTHWLHWGGGHFAPQILDTVDWVELYSFIKQACTTAGSLNAVRFLTLSASGGRPSMTPFSPRVEERRARRSAAYVTSLDPAETVTAEDAANFWISFDSACRQGSRTDAFWLLQAAQHVLSADAIWSAIHIASRGGAPTADALATLHKKAGPHPMSQLLHQAAAVLILCIPTKERIFETKPLLTKAYKREWDAWTAVIGRRAARIHAIPVEALHADTVRGQIPFKYTNIGDVRDPIAVLSEGCRFWQEALRSSGIEVDADEATIAFPDDTVLENFYDRYFPDDIPDEWSKADQEKSHGRGQQDKGHVNLIPTPCIREEPVSQREWSCGIYVRSKKVKRP